MKTQFKSRLETLKEIIQNTNFQTLKPHQKQIFSHQLIETIHQYFPKLYFAEQKQDLFQEKLLKNDEIIKKMQRLIETHLQITALMENLDGEDEQKLKKNSENLEFQIQNSIAAGKKITRAAIARRNEKNQEEIRKDQIFVRLIPRSQNCIQFMLSNRNFPRLQCKLSCNQHLEYLVNYLTNKWIRGKIGFKIVLYPDAMTFLKNASVQQKQKVLRQPLNNYLMFTDIMSGCGIGQNGMLNLNYEVEEIKKASLKNSLNNNQANSQQQKNMSGMNSSSIRNKFGNGERNNNLKKGVDEKKVNEEQFGVKEEQHAFKSKDNGNSFFNNEMSMFNTIKNNSNFLYQNHHQEESLFGSIGFNLGFGQNSINSTHKKIENIISQNSINYLELPKLHQFQKQEQPNLIDQDLNSQIHQNQAELVKSDDKKVGSNLGNLIDFIEQVGREKEVEAEFKFKEAVEVKPENHLEQVNPQIEEQSQNSNRIVTRDVKTVSITKKRTTPNC